MNAPDPAAMPLLHSASTHAVRVRAPGRLHLGFLDPAGTLGRRFGSLGLVIGGFETEIELLAAADGQDHVEADGAAAQAEARRVMAHLGALRERSGLPDPLHVRLHRVLPAHAGFGSGTQLALAVGRAFATWHGIEASTPQLAQWLGRGLRSGVGIAGFDQGGLLLDGGPGPGGAPAPLLARLELPAAWRVIVVLDPRAQGLFGAEEKQALAALAPLPAAAAAELCHRVLMQVLPGAADGDFPAFARGLTQMQRLLGAHFAPVQRGSAYASAAVARAMQAIEQAAGDGGAGTGQSSWGPTAFALVPSAESAAELIAAAAGAIDPALQLQVVAPRNTGATVES